MKKQIGLILIACLAAQASCKAQDTKTTAVGSSSQNIVGDTGGADLEQSIRDLIDPSKLDFKLSPDGLEEIQSAEETEISAEDVVAALSSVAPGETLVASSEGAQRWEGYTQTFSVLLDHKSRLVDIGVAKEWQIEPTETDGVDDAAVADSLRTFLLALGAREEELGDDAVRALLSQTQDETDGTDGPILMVGKAAFISRQLGGIPVMSNAVHLTVTPQGELSKISGRWTPIDYAHSVLTSAITEEEVVDRAVSALVETDIHLEYSPKVVIRTAYRIVNDASYGEIVMLKGFATTIYHQELGISDDDGRSASSETMEFELQ